MPHAFNCEAVSSQKGLGCKAWLPAGDSPKQWDTRRNDAEVAHLVYTQANMRNIKQTDPSDTTDIIEIMFDLTLQRYNISMSSTNDVSSISLLTELFNLNDVYNVFYNTEIEPHSTLNNDDTIDTVRLDLLPFSRNLKVLSFNARSIPAKYLDVYMLIEKTDCDIVAVTETWINASVPPSLYEVPGYTLIRVDRKNKRGGGVAIYIKNYFQFKKININNIVGELNPDLEQLWIEFLINRRKLIVGVIYRPEYINDKVHDNLYSVFEYFASNDNLIVLGDFNYDLLQRQKYAQINDIIAPLNLTQMVDKPTRVTDVSSTLIDLVILNSPGRCKFLGVTDIHNISDHKLIYFAYSLKLPVFKPKCIKCRNFKKLDKTALESSVRGTPWELAEVPDVLDDKLLVLNNYVKAIFDEHVPIKTIRVTHPPNPWLSKEIQEHMKYRNKLHAKYVKLKAQVRNATNYCPSTNLQFNQAERLYKIARNTCKRMQRDAKHKYFNKSVNANINNQKMLWLEFDQVGVVDRKNTDAITEFSPDTLNNTFLINNNRDVDEVLLNAEVTHFTSISPSHNFVFSSVTESQVAMALNSIRSNATGLDGISLKMLKLCLPYCIPSITHILNFSLMNSTFPSSWKLGKVFPVPKCDNPTKPEEYRPISILPTLSKILEKLVHKQLSSFLEQHQLLDSHQSGFRTGYSTESALLCILNDLTWACDNGLLSLLVLLDFSKAFDTINHKLLLAKLKALGCSEFVVKWFESYLSNRYQQVISNSELSERKLLKSGVPQGSVLGPLLFIIFTSDFKESLNCSNYHLYADDSQIYTHFERDNHALAIEAINNNLNNIVKWANSRFLILNEMKSKVLVVGSKHNLNYFYETCRNHVTINNVSLPFSSCVKNLGVLFDSTLTFENHVNQKIKCAYIALRKLNRFKNMLSIELKTILCNCLVLSHFNYCSSVFSNAKQYIIHKIQLVQNSCLRFIFGLKQCDHVTYNQ